MYPTLGNYHSLLHYRPIEKDRRLTIAKG